MRRYETLEMEIIFFISQDIITNSKNESADDIGVWDSNWFSSDNG